MSLLNAYENDICDQTPAHQQFTPLDSTDIMIAMGLALTTAIITIHGLGVQSLATWDEAIYGVVIRELLARHELTLCYAGVPWFEKSPFLF